MSRPLRVQYPGAVYHITSRGNVCGDIFFSDNDRALFLDVLSRTINRFQWRCYAYCLMTNHYHLLIETPAPNLCRGMRHLNGVYTQALNRRHGRVGHIFQGRYKAILVQKDNHLLELCRYVVLNPVRAGLTRDAAGWAWSSYRAAVGQVPIPEWLDVMWILSQFGDERDQAVFLYQRFVRDGIIRKPWESLQGQIYYGDEKFAGEMTVKNEAGAAFTKEIPKAQQQPVRPALSELVRAGTSDEIGRAYLRYGYRLNEIAKHLGVHYVTASRRLKEYECSKIVDKC